MKYFIKNLFAIAALIVSEGLFLQGYFTGSPNNAYIIPFIAAIGAILGADHILAKFEKTDVTRSHDKELFDDFLRSLPNRPTIHLLKEHDFGDAYYRDSLVPLFEFADSWISVEKEFLDANLEAKKKSIVSAAIEFTNELSARTVPVRMEGFSSVFSDRQREIGQRPASVIEDARILNTLAENFVTKYESFVRLCRETLVK